MKMENSYSNGNHTDPGLQIIRHPLYQTSGRFSLHWFDARVFYVRISNFMVDDTTPECLTLNHIPASPDTVLEVNGVRCSIESDGVSCVLRRDRVDKKSEEATFVSTESIRFTGSVRFEVFDKEDLVIAGVLEMSCSNGCVGEQQHNTARKWCMNCESVINAGAGFLKRKQITGSESSSPTIEVYVAGSSSGTPVILTKSVQLHHRKKHRKAVLHSIPEYDASESHGDFVPGHDLQVAEYKGESAEEYGGELFWRQGGYIEGEDGELSWFNAGVRVGVGIGLGVCLGVGIGVGLLVRTYHTTARAFKRRLL